MKRFSTKNRQKESLFEPLEIELPNKDGNEFTLYRIERITSKTFGEIQDALANFKAKEGESLSPGDLDSFRKAMAAAIGCDVKILEEMDHEDFIELMEFVGENILSKLGGNASKKRKAGAKR